MPKLTHAAAVLTLPVLLPGCIVYEIRDELANTNQQLDGLESRLAERLALLDDVIDTSQSIEQTLVRVDASLASANEHLETIGGDLVATQSQLKTIDQNLVSTQAKLGEVETSLGRLDEHLASLRKTINNIDSTIPFLSISGDDDETADALEAEGADKPDAQDPAPNPEPPAGADTPG